MGTMNQTRGKIPTLHDWRGNLSLSDCISRVLGLSPWPVTPSAPVSMRSNCLSRDPPPLPEIQSEQIRQRIFTHSSSLDKCHKHAFQAPESDVPVDNEE
jgi:hypothetical protein